MEQNTEAPQKIVKTMKKKKNVKSRDPNSDEQLDEFRFARKLVALGNNYIINHQKNNRKDSIFKKNIISSSDQLSPTSKKCIDLKSRNRGIKHLTSWLARKSTTRTLEFKKVWKALYYCKNH